MTPTVRIAALVLFLTCLHGTGLAQSVDKLRFQAFYQRGANNCVSVALIKAAIQRHGFQVFDTVRSGDAVRLTLRDQTVLTVLDAERRQAARAAAFATGAVELPPAERTAIIRYATLCYAALAKYVQTQRVYGCTKDDNSVQQFPAKTSFEAALKFIGKTGFCSDNAYRHLGLMVQDATAPPYNPDTNYSARQGIVAYSNKHAVFVLGTEFDSYGSWLPLENRVRGRDARFEPRWVFELK